MKKFLSSVLLIVMVLSLSAANAPRSAGSAEEKKASGVERKTGVENKTKPSVETKKEAGLQDQQEKDADSGKAAAAYQVSAEKEKAKRVSGGKNSEVREDIASFFEALYSAVHDYTGADSTRQSAFAMICVGVGVLLAFIIRKLFGVGRERTDRRFLHYLSNECASPLSSLVLISLCYMGAIPFLAEVRGIYHVLTLKSYLILVSVIIAWIVCRLIEAGAGILVKTPERFDPLLVGVVKRILKFVVGLIAFFFIGQNILNLNITALLAGAGVAGLAVAFAAQDSIANFFGSVMLIIDKPFTVGDVIKIDSFLGTVERVGLRSTTLRGLNGHLFTIPNKNAAGVPVENITKRPSIKNVINLGLTYDTPPEKMERAMAILNEIFVDYDGYQPETPSLIHFTEFKDFSLNIQVIFWVHPGDFIKNLNVTNKTNLEILRRFNAEGLNFAFPTHTAYLTTAEPLAAKVELCTGTQK